MNKIYRGYEIIKTDIGYAATDKQFGKAVIVARGATEEKVMDNIDAWKRRVKSGRN